MEVEEEYLPPPSHLGSNHLLPSVAKVHHHRDSHHHRVEVPGDLQNDFAFLWTAVKYSEVAKLNLFHLKQEFLEPHNQVLETNLHERHSFSLLENTDVVEYSDHQGQHLEDLLDDNSCPLAIPEKLAWSLLGCRSIPLNSVPMARRHGTRILHPKHPHLLHDHLDCRE